MNTRLNPFAVVTQQGAAPGSKAVFNLPDEVYHADLGVTSCSMLKKMLVSPADYQHALTTPGKVAPALDFGTLVHLLVLQPHLVPGLVAVFPGSKGSGDRPRKAYVEFADLHVGRLIVDEPTYREAVQVRDRVLEKVVMGRPFGDFVHEGTPEASLYYIDPNTDVECRCRVDLLHPEVSFDLKTTRFATTAGWKRQALDLDYDMQAYMYSLARCMYEGESQPKPFVFVAAVNEAPYSVAARVAGLSFMEEGGRKYQHAMISLAACCKSNVWPALCEDDTLEVAPWEQKTLARSWAP